MVDLKTCNQCKRFRLPVSHDGPYDPNQLCSDPGNADCLVIQGQTMLQGGLEGLLDGISDMIASATKSPFKIDLNGIVKRFQESAHQAARSRPEAWVAGPASTTASRPESGVDLSADKFTELLHAIGELYGAALVEKGSVPPLTAAAIRRVVFTADELDLEGRD